MGQDKEKLVSLFNFIEELYNDTDNKEFIESIDTLVLSNISSDIKKIASEQTAGNDVSRKSYILMGEIYELCLANVLREHALRFYKDFPIDDIKESLIKDFIKMEISKRAGDLDYFCLHMYQQIEHVINYLAKVDPALQNSCIYMLDQSKYICYKGRVSDRYVFKDSPESNTIRRLLFGVPYDGEDLKQKNRKSPGFFDLQISELEQMMKFKYIWYFVGCQGKMTNEDAKEWKEITDTIVEIYYCRNKVHRGTPENKKQKEVYARVSPQIDFYIYKFYGVFAKFINGICNGYPIPSDLIQFANTLCVKEPQMQEAEG